MFLNRFSPTGFYSSAVNNDFIQELRERSERQVAYSTEPVGEHVAEYGVGPRRRVVYLTAARSRARALTGRRPGFTEALRTPDCTLIFVTPGEGARNLLADQVACMGCLSQCRFSNWSQEGRTTPPARRPIRAASASRRRCRPSPTSPTRTR